MELIYILYMSLRAVQLDISVKVDTIIESHPRVTL